MKQGLVTLLYNFGKRFMGWTLHMIMCVLLCYPLSIHMSQLLSTGRPISSLKWTWVQAKIDLSIEAQVTGCSPSIQYQKIDHGNWNIISNNPYCGSGFQKPPIIGFILPQVHISQSDCSICGQCDVILPFLDEKYHSDALFVSKLLICICLECKETI